MIISILTAVMLKQKSTGVYKQLLFYGVNYKHIYIGSYLVDVALFAVIGIMFTIYFLILTALNIYQMDGLWLPMIL